MRPLAIQFAWPKEQMATLRVEFNATALTFLGAQVRRSLLRLSAIDLRLVPSASCDSRCPEPAQVFDVPNVQAIQLPRYSRWNEPDTFLLLRHPAAQQLRSFDISRSFPYECSPAVLQQLTTLPHLHSLSFGVTLCHDVNAYVALQHLSLLPSLIHLSFAVPEVEEQLYFILFQCPRLTSLGLEGATVTTDLVNCLAELPVLRRLKFTLGRVGECTAHAWTALRSLREIQLDEVWNINHLLPLLSSAPALRLLRCHCRAPRTLPSSQFFPPCLPVLEPLRRLLTAAPLLQVELLMPLTFDEWNSSTLFGLSEDLMTSRRRCWDELELLPDQLSCVCIADVDDL
jgi:hypothetical protein